MNDTIFKEIMAGCSANQEWYDGYMRFNQPRIESDFAFICKYANPNHCFLDIGGTPPLLTALLHQKGYSNICVVDPFAHLFSAYFEKNNIQAQTGNVLDDDIPAWHERFDFVACCEVIEHLGGNMLDAMTRCVRYVKPGGLFMVTSPNLRSITGLLALVYYHSGLASKAIDNVRAQYERASAAHAYFGHLREYTEKEVCDLFQSMGLVHITSDYQPNYIIQTKAQRWAAGLERLIPRWRLFGKYLFQKAFRNNKQRR